MGLGIPTRSYDQHLPSVVFARGVEPGGGHKDAAGDRLYEAIILAVKTEAEKRAEKTATVLPGREPS